MQAIPCFENVTLFVEAKSTNKKNYKSKVGGCWFERQGMVVQGVFFGCDFFLKFKTFGNIKTVGSNVITV